VHDKNAFTVHLGQVLHLSHGQFNQWHGAGQYSRCRLGVAINLTVPPGLRRPSGGEFVRVNLVPTEATKEDGTAALEADLNNRAWSA